MRRYLRQINVVIIFVLLISLLQPGAFVRASISDLPVTDYGTVIDVRKTELAPGAMYTWMDLQNERGLQKIHAVEFNPQNSNLELRAGTKDGKVYGMKGVTEMAAYADSPGNRVIAGINGDFYEISGFATGVPNGLFMMMCDPEQFDLSLYFRFKRKWQLDLWCAEADHERND